MKIKKLYAENIYSFKKLEVDFLAFAGVISIILGKNLDQKTANGAGKTSILKALYWALWNKELNGATIEEMVNRVFPDNGMLAILEFEDRGYEYKITRYKSYKPNSSSPKLHNGDVVSGSGVEFLVNGQPFMGESHSKTQGIIEQKIRMTPRLFLSCVLMAQNTKNTFLTANDSEKKELLSELLDLQAYEKAFKNVKEAIKDVEEKIAQNENKIDILNEQIDSLKNQINQLESQEKEYDDEIKVKKQSMSKQIATFEAELEELKKLAVLEIKSEKLREELNIEENQIKSLKKEIESENQINQALASIENQIKNDEELVVSIHENIESKKNKLESINLDEPNEDIDIESLKTKLNNEIKQANDKGNELEKIRSELQGKISNKSNLLKIQQSLQEELKTIEHQLSELKNNSLCTSCLRVFKEGESQSLDNLLSKTKEKEKSLKSEITNYAEQLLQIDLNQKNLDDVLIKIFESQKELEKLDLDKNYILKMEMNRNLALQKKELFSKQKEEIIQEISDLENKNQNINKQVKVNQKKVNEILKLKQKFLPLKESLSKLEEKISSLKENISKAESLEIDIRLAKTRFKEKIESINNHKKELFELENKTNPYLGMKNNLIKQNDNFKNKLDVLRKTVAENQEELKYLNFWKIGFAPIGIRSFITDDVIELLNRKTQENLNDLFDGAISVMFDPESTNNKGLVSNKISTVFLQNGKETNFNLLSGGEQQRAILATELALTEVAEARAGTKLNIRFLDEPFNGMDNNGQVKSLSLFARIARDKDGFFVISHDENFQHLCQKALFVLKSKEISYIVDKENFNSTFIDKDSDSSEEPKKEKRKFNIDKALKRKKEEDEE